MTRKKEIKRERKRCVDRKKTHMHGRVNVLYALKLVRDVLLDGQLAR